ncbi:MAG: DMT family transporter [bacterium]|nr:DMT family transporter [Candidatus Jorgensenbacteria bacterium]
MHSIGIIFALIALVSWGLGDFLIQKSARRFGDWVALFYITAFGSVILFPFITGNLYLLISSGGGFFVLMGASIIILFAALLEFKAFRIGKLSAIEPILALEVPITVALATYVIRERLDFIQTSLVLLLMFGVLLVSIRSFKNIRNMTLEAGVFYALLATVAMGFVNFLFGIGSREIGPLFINWFASFFIAIVSFLYLASKKQLGLIAEGWGHSKKLIFWVSAIDNSAWVAYSYSTTYIPIAIATSVSEAYIAFAAILGVVINKEHLYKHQVFGIILAVISVVALSAITAV